MDKVSASQPRDRGFEPHTGDDHDSSYDTSTGWFQEAESRVININCLNLFHNRAKINMVKLNVLKFIELMRNENSVSYIDYVSLCMKLLLLDKTPSIL